MVTMVKPHTVWIGGPPFLPSYQCRPQKKMIRALSSDQVDDIKRQRESGVTYKQLARKFNVSMWTIRDACSNQGAYAY